MDLVQAAVTELVTKTRINLVIASVQLNLIVVV
jgi:hypothetical protein